MVRIITPLLRPSFHQRTYSVLGFASQWSYWSKSHSSGRSPHEGGFVAVTLGVAGFVGFVGLGLVLQDLRDDPVMRLGGDEDLREDQQARWSSALLTLILSDAS